jgi:hypothetical protein
VNIVTIEDEPDRRDVRPAIGTDRGQRGGPRPLKQEGADLVRGHSMHRALLGLLVWSHLFHRSRGWIRSESSYAVGVAAAVLPG